MEGHLHIAASRVDLAWANATWEIKKKKRESQLYRCGVGWLLSSIWPSLLLTPGHRMRGERGGERHRKVGKRTDTTKTWVGEMLTMEEDVDADSDACERATLVSERGEKEM